MLHPNLKNGLLPSWRSVYKDASTQISRALDNIIRLSALERRLVVSEVLNTLRLEYMSMKSSTPDIHTVTAMQSQLKLLPKEWVCGVFDKGIVALWGGCQQFFFPRFYATFFQSPRRFTHLTECDTKVDCNVQLSSFIAHAGRRFFLGGKQPPVAELDPTVSLRAKNGLSAANATRLELRLRPITAECSALITKCITRTEKALRQYTKPKNAARTTLKQLTRGLKGPCKSAKHGTTGNDGDANTRPRLKPLPCPDCQLLVKWKSDENATPPVIKGREVLTCALHPLKPATSLCGRALTLFWKEVVSVLGPREIISMSSLLHCVRDWTNTCDKSETWDWVEYDIREMFLELPRNEILNALVQLQVKVRTTIGPIHFFLSKDANRKLDHMARGQPSHFTRLAFHDVLHIALYDLQLNDLFLCLISVMSQNTGIPIGGPMSAQLASLTLIYKEIVHPLPWGLQHAMWVRYRDNFLFVMRCLPGVNLPVLHESYRQELEILTGMQITLEQVGTTIRFLECQLSDPASAHPITLPDFLAVDEKPSSPSYVRKLIDGGAVNWPSMVASLVPNMVKKGFHYRLARVSLEMNLQRVYDFLRTKYGAVASWTSLFRQHKNKWS